jgi:two-component system, OmpR family, alkaline phosphatase synthesis response regulator PhoP
LTKILVIDDEPNIVELVKLYLAREGYQVDTAATAADGLSKAASLKPDLIILDVMLPDMDGLEVCRRIRAESSTPILMLSARREDVDRIVGLELGADDYLTKPFNPHELTARVKAILRRARGAPSAEQKVIDIAGLHIDLDRHEVTVAGQPVALRSKEFALLAVFAQNPGIVLSRERLLTQVWGYDFYGETRTVDVHVNHLRDKLAGSGVDIETLRGTGYKLAASGEKR